MISRTRIFETWLQPRNNDLVPMFQIYVNATAEQVAAGKYLISSKMVINGTENVYSTRNIIINSTISKFYEIKQSIIISNIVEPRIFSPNSM